MELPPHTTVLVPRCRPVEGVWQGHARGRRLIFLHIPKTAGTAITTFLRQQFVDEDVMPQLQANFHRSHPLWPLVSRRYRLLGVGMHLDHDRVAALARGLTEEAPPFLLTVLREPRARLLSRYKEWRSTPDEHMQAARDHVKEAILTARTQSFSEFLHSDNPVVVSTLDNLQARLLAGLNLSRKLQPDEVLERAHANLACYDLVGTTASCDDTLKALAIAYDWPTPTSELARVHQSHPVADEALYTSDADEERIAAYTALDQKLWDSLMQGALHESPRTAGAPSAAVPPTTPTRSLTAELQLISPPKPSLPADHTSPQPAESQDLGAGFPTVMSLISRSAPTRVFGVGRKKWFPSLDDDPTPLGHDERVMFVLRFPALSHQRSMILHQAAGPAESLLAITEIDENDARLAAFARHASMQPYLALEGASEHAVLVFAVGRYRRDHGDASLDTVIESLERTHSTHPKALRSLHDTPAARALAELVLQRGLTAAAGLLHDTSSPAALAALVETLRPEDHDPLLPSVAAQRASQADMRQPVALEVLLDLYDALFHMLGELVTQPTIAPAHSPG